MFPYCFPPLAISIHLNHASKEFAGDVPGNILTEPYRGSLDFLWIRVLKMSLQINKMNDTFIFTCQRIWNG
jgi:hypothetical protein